MANKTASNQVVATTAGAVAGCIEVLTIWPMEMIKTNMQLGTMKQHYTGMLGGFKYHVRTDGVLSLYRGLAPVLIGSIPTVGIRFGAFDFFKHKFAGEKGETPLRNLAAGVAAGAMEATLAFTPVRLVEFVVHECECLF
jgi:solute carrier family 25 (mitochondrial citrate transporter), member 1